MTSTRTVAWAAVVAASLAACAVHLDVETYAVPGAEVAGRETFYWKGGDVHAAAQLDPATVASAREQVRRVVVEELVRKGYREVPSQAGADLVASFQVSGMRRFVLEDTTRVGAPSPNTVLSPGITPMIASTA